jgi:hypothetical protein
MRRFARRGSIRGNFDAAFGNPPNVSPGLIQIRDRGGLGPLPHPLQFIPNFDFCFQHKLKPFTI